MKNGSVLILSTPIPSSFIELMHLLAESRQTYMFVFGACRTYERTKTDVCLFSLQIKSLGDGRDTNTREGQDEFCLTQSGMYKRFL